MHHCRQSRSNKLNSVQALALLAFFVVFLTHPGDSLRAQEPVSEEWEQLHREMAEQQQVIQQLQWQTEFQQTQLDELRQSFYGKKLPEVAVEEVAKTADQALPAASSDSPEPRGLQYGYADGFFVTSPGGVKIGAKDSPFTMKVNVRTQLRHSYFNSGGTTRDENNFEFERFFLILTGNVYTPDLAYHIKVDADSDETEGLDLLDGYVTFDAGHALWDCSPGTFGIKAGKWKVPFHRARQESGFNLQFVDRAMASEFFDLNRSIGVGVFGTTDALPRPVSWEAALMNGFQTQRFVPGRAGELDRNFATAVRVTSDLIGDYGRDGEPDLSCHDRPAVRVGAAFAYTSLTRMDGLREFSVPRVVDTGATLASVLPAAATEFDELLYSVDANFKYQGMSVLSEYYFRSITKFSGASVPDLFDHGFLLQAGSFLVRDKLEMSSRWSRIVGDSGTLGGVNRKRWWPWSEPGTPANPMRWYCLTQ